MDPYTITAISGLITGLSVILGQLTSSLVTVYQARQKAKQDELALLRDEVRRLHDEKKDLEQESDRHRAQAQRAGSETLWLRTYLREQKLTAPPLPEELLPPESNGPGPNPPSAPAGPEPSGPKDIHPLPPGAPPWVANPPGQNNLTERK